MGRFFKAVDALCIVFDDEEAGEISQDEENDEVENSDEFIAENEDFDAMNLDQNYNKDEKISLDNSSTLAISSSSMSLSSEIFKKPMSLKNSASIMSVSSDHFLEGSIIKASSSVSVMSIPTSTFFKPIEPYTSISLNSISSNNNFESPESKKSKNKATISTLTKNLFKKSDKNAKSAKNEHRRFCLCTAGVCLNGNRAQRSPRGHRKH